MIDRKGDEVYVAITLSRKVAAAEVSQAFRSSLLCLFMYVCVCVKFWVSVSRYMLLWNLAFVILEC
jgi:hypothetical protein